MKSVLLLLLFLLFPFSKNFAQEFIQFALIDLDTIENYLINQIQIRDEKEKLIKKDGQLLVEKFIEDINFVQKRSRGGCMSAKQMKEYENYLKAVQNKIMELEKSMNQILKKRNDRNIQEIKILLKREFERFGNIHQYQLVPQEGVLYQKKENPNVTFDLISFIQNSKGHPNWIQDQVISDHDISFFYMQLLLIKYFFKNYKLKWVRERWN